MIFIFFPYRENKMDKVFFFRIENESIKNDEMLQST
jgi:hypothetical protein